MPDTQEASPLATAPLLRVRGLHCHYGAIEALRGIDLEIAEGEIVTLIGANGAGKSTLLMSLCGKPKPSSGEIWFDGANITGCATFEIIRRGISIVPEGRRIFSKMTVLENLKMGAIHSDPAQFAGDLERIYSIFPLLSARPDQRGGTLSGGEQQMLAIARALMSRPKLLLLDEPSLGLAPLMVRQIFTAIRDINQQHGTTVFLVEQNAYHALKIAARGYVLMQGQVALSGASAELMSNPQVRSAYLEGGRGDSAHRGIQP
jgi:branched-chain amino acid transport system ATP-binding protein